MKCDLSFKECQKDLERQAKQAGVGPLAVALTLSRVDLYLALNKETPDELVQKLQKALDEMRAQGELGTIKNGYL